jgi:hypothetical protein
VEVGLSKQKLWGQRLQFARGVFWFGVRSPQSQSRSGTETLREKRNNRLRITRKLAFHSEMASELITFFGRDFELCRTDAVRLCQPLSSSSQSASCPIAVLWVQFTCFHFPSF